MSELLAKKPTTVSPGKIKMMMFAKSGVGKTWLAMDFPAPYYIDCEGGARLAHYQKKLSDAGGAYFGIEEGALNFDTVIDEIKKLATSKHAYKTLAIGSITKIYQTAIANEVERLGEKDAFGLSKKPAIANMRRLINWIQKLDMNVLFEAHESVEWGKNERTGQREEIGQQPDAWEKLIYELDLTLRLEKVGASRYAHVRKSRLVGFPEGERFALEYAEFEKRYGRDFIQGDVMSIKLASEDQVKMINNLVSLVKVDEKQIEKILTKAGAEGWSELNEKQADETIKWLKNMVKV